MSGRPAAAVIEEWRGRRRRDRALDACGGLSELALFHRGGLGGRGPPGLLGVDVGRRCGCPRRSGLTGVELYSRARRHRRGRRPVSATIGGELATLEETLDLPAFDVALRGVLGGGTDPTSRRRGGRPLRGRSVFAPPYSPPTQQRAQASASAEADHYRTSPSGCSAGNWVSASTGALALFRPWCFDGPGAVSVGLPAGGR